MTEVFTVYRRTTVLSLLQRVPSSEPVTKVFGGFYMAFGILGWPAS